MIWHSLSPRNTQLRISFREGGYTPNSPYKSVETLFSPWLSLDLLRGSLDVQEVNTGKQYNLLGSSGIEWSLVAYRGQPSEHLPCLPSIGRLKDPQEELLAFCRCIAFEMVIGEHPYVRLCEAAKFLDAPLFIDREGLAQHYGLPTDLLDVSNSFDVASFFATSVWDSAARGYVPVKFSSAPGVMYRVPSCFYVPGQSEATFRDVGWQPLHRPAQQRAAAFRLKKGVDFVALPRVEKVLFSHSARVSTRIWKSFDGGKALFPDDAPAELSERAKGLYQFTREQIDLAWGRFDAWHGAVSDSEKRQRLETATGLVVVDAPVLSWDGLAVERDESKLRDELNEVLSRVRFRSASYG